MTRHSHHASIMVSGPQRQLFATGCDRCAMAHVPCLHMHIRLNLTAPGGRCLGDFAGACSQFFPILASCIQMPGCRIRYRQCLGWSSCQDVEDCVAVRLSSSIVHVAHPVTRVSFPICNGLGTIAWIPAGSTDAKWGYEEHTGCSVRSAFGLVLDATWFVGIDLLAHRQWKVGFP
jgi:hypothetical protein